MNDEIEKISERGICSRCRQPSLLWQPWRNLFRCGWCGKDFEITEALQLTRLTDQQYKKVTRLREDVIARAARGKKRN